MTSPLKTEHDATVDTKGQPIKISYALHGLLHGYAVTATLIILLSALGIMVALGVARTHVEITNVLDLTQDLQSRSQRMVLIVQNYGYETESARRVSLLDRITDLANDLEQTESYLLDHYRDVVAIPTTSKTAPALINGPIPNAAYELDRHLRYVIKETRRLIASGDQNQSIRGAAIANISDTVTGPLNNAFGIIMAHARSIEVSNISYAKNGIAALLIIITGLTLLQVTFCFRPAARKLQSATHDLKQTRDDLNEAQNKTKIADRSKTEFLANMSHELRTPLNSIIGFSELIKNETLGPVGISKYAEYAKHINGSGTHLLELVTDVLDVSRIETGSIKLSEGLFDVRSLVASSIRMVRDRAYTSGVRLDVRVAENLPLINVDDRRIKQILVNLLSNSIKFSSAPAVVILTVALDDYMRMTFTISDTGIGIAEETIETIMTPFGQADASLSRKHEGAGIGLPLARHLTEIHGGVLMIDSQLDRGTSVTVRLPSTRTQGTIPATDVPTFLKRTHQEGAHLN